MAIFKVDFYKIRGLRKNYAVRTHKFLEKPALLALGETQICPDSDPSDFNLPGYTFIPLLFSDINLVLDWGYNNRVEFNAQKTQHCLPSAKQTAISKPLKINDAEIEEGNSFSILGMTVTKDLRWNELIYSIAKNASRSLGYLKRCKKLFSPLDLATIYTAFIRPKMEYN